MFDRKKHINLRHFCNHPPSEVRWGVCDSSFGPVCVLLLLFECSENNSLPLTESMFNKDTPPAPPSFRLCVCGSSNMGPARPGSSYHPSETPGCCGTNTEATLTPTPAKTKNTLCKMNSVMPFDNNPQTDWDRRTRTCKSRLDSTSGPLGFQYGQHNLKMLERPRCSVPETGLDLDAAPNASSHFLVMFQIWFKTLIRPTLFSGNNLPFHTCMGTCHLKVTRWSQRFPRSPQRQMCWPTAFKAECVWLDHFTTLLSCCTNMDASWSLSSQPIISTLQNKPLPISLAANRQQKQACIVLTFFCKENLKKLAISVWWGGLPTVK